MPIVSDHSLHVLTVPAFNDNYLWLIHDGEHAAVVDPGDASPILAALAEHQLSLVAILLTHHHADHAGGVPTLLKHAKVPVYGPANEKIPTITHPLHDGDLLHIVQLDLHLAVLEVPGHTSGHIAYFAETQHWLFCGDTLFAGGCGRLFEGTPKQMLTSLTRLAQLPDDTAVYCAHEYTLANLRFAHEIEPNNAALNARIITEQARRSRGEATVPSSIKLEKETNPFLRVAQSSVIMRLRETGRLQQSDPVATFAALREWKNNYK